jgi:trehalose/maltose hydrolase-like predicted phosphorylase
MRLPANVTLEKLRHPRSKWGTYVPGITGIHPMLKEELVNLPNPLWLQTICDGETLDMDRCCIENYHRELNLKNGILNRSLIWKTRSNARIACFFERFASMSHKHLILQKVTYTAIEGTVRLVIRGGVNPDVRTNGYNHFSQVACSTNGGEQTVELVTDNADRVMLSASMTGMPFQISRAGFEGSLALNQGEAVTVYKTTRIWTSRDLDNPPMMPELHGYSELMRLHCQAWEQRWRQAAVSIQGDEKAQMAVNFSVYHLLRCATELDDRIAVCAKGFSGEAYFGHFFWDTEIYLLPFYLYNFPDTAKNLTRFRINTLEGAKKNAAAYGYSGAKYAWESSVSGEEQCPNWQYADHEVHVSADVALGLWHVCKATNDPDFILLSLPVFMETAKYWLDRISFLPDGSATIKGVMGPDEYKLMCDTNAYTNYLVRFSLQKTLEIMSMTQHEDNRLKQRLQQAIDTLRCPSDVQEIIPQFDGFEKLDEPEFNRYWLDRSKRYGTCVPQERIFRSKALKQADALMLPFLFPSRFTSERIEKNLDYYLPYTTHDSSLSSVVHSVLLSRSGKADLAYALFAQALDIDLDPTGGGAAEGVHIANCGGIWQAIVMGFAGMRPAYEASKLSFSPCLPAHWKSLRFRIAWQGKVFEVYLDCKNKEIRELI